MSYHVDSMYCSASINLGVVATAVVMVTYANPSATSSTRAGGTRDQRYHETHKRGAVQSRHTASIVTPLSSVRFVLWCARASCTAPSLYAMFFNEPAIVVAVLHIPEERLTPLLITSSAQLPTLNDFLGFNAAATRV